VGAFSARVQHAISAVVSRASDLAAITAAPLSTPSSLWPLSGKSGRVVTAGSRLGIRPAAA
jgi:hypothetical protein